MVWFLIFSTFLALFVNISFFVKKEDNEFIFGILLFSKEITFKKKKKKFSFKKFQKEYCLIRNLICRSKIRLLDITTFTKISGDSLEPFYYTFLMTSINTLRNTLAYYSYGIMKEEYHNVIILEGKNDFTFKCIFNIKIGNIIIAIFKWLGDIYGQSSRRNA